MAKHEIPREALPAEAAAVLRALDKAPMPVFKTVLGQARGALAGLPRADLAYDRSWAGSPLYSEYLRRPIPPRIALKDYFVGSRRRSLLRELPGVGLVNAVAESHGYVLAMSMPAALVLVDTAQAHLAAAA